MPTIDDNPRLEPIRQIRRSIRFVSVATVLFGAYVTHQVTQMEYGLAQRVRLWRPIADLYNSLGFWPAVMCVPVFGLLIAVALAWKLRSIRE
jgi:hypothetical protein